MLIEEAKKVADLRAKVLANIQNGLPPHAGLDLAEVEECVRISRKEYTANQAKSSATGVSAPSAMPTLDLEALFTTKKSG